MSEKEIDTMIAKLSVDERVTVINYGGIKTFRSRKNKRGN
jgi:hypothetical protein